jgi:ABC-2 type transport system ATP-binding protein
MAQTAHHLLVIGHGRLLADASIEDVLARGSSSVKVRTPRAEELDRLLSSSGATVRTVDNHLEVSGIAAASIGDLAAEHGIALHELTPQQASLEDAFFELTEAAVEYHAGNTPTSTGSAPR